MLALVPVILVFILYFSSIPISFALFGSTLFYFGIIDNTSPVALLLQKLMQFADVLT
jgi:hypothetical protein